MLIPANPSFSSLNLASAVQLLSYELFLAARDQDPPPPVEKKELPSRQIEMEHFYDHLKRALDSRGFLEGEMREVTMMKLRRLFARARPHSGELKILHTLMKLIHKDGS